MARIKLNVYEERILRILRMYYEKMTINEIASSSGIHWETAKKHVDNLVKQRVIKKLENNYFQARRIKI